MLFRKVNYQSGVALLETTLVVPVLLILLIGSTFISLKLQARSLVTNVAQEGARIKSKDSNINRECTSLSELKTMVIKAEICPGDPTATSAVPASHIQIYDLLRIMNERDNKFRITNIKVQTRYEEGNNGDNDRVVVDVSADIDVNSLFSDSILERAGTLGKTLHATASHPYLLTVN